MGTKGTPEYATTAIGVWTRNAGYCHGKYLGSINSINLLEILYSSFCIHLLSIYNFSLILKKKKKERKEKKTFPN